MKILRMAALPLIALALILAAGAPVRAAETQNKPGTRDLVFEDEEALKTAEEEEKVEVDKVAGGEKISITTSLELTRDGKTEIVAPNSTFKSGDRVKLVYTPGMDGHIYWMSRMTSGKFTMLFPTARTGLDNAVKKGEKYTMPVKGSFRFDEKTGTEILICMISPQKIAVLDAAIAEADKAGQQVDLTQLDKAINNLGEQNLNKRQTRDLVFEEDEDEKSLTKTQTVKPGDTFVATYELIHE
ncbi:MAG: DUF4384 domain-containing protein [Desulfovibrio sp.]|jgi:hypothetical protein|nr:DUF4384 domain-containing protein [Desulfovibrio sp.]